MQNWLQSQLQTAPVDWPEIWGNKISRSPPQCCQILHRLEKVLKSKRHLLITYLFNNFSNNQPILVKLGKQCGGDVRNFFPPSNFRSTDRFQSEVITNPVYSVH